MQVTAQQVFKDWDARKFKPLYLIVGEESFQAGEILSRAKQAILTNESDVEFNFERWDGEQLDAGALLSSLETLPGLFSAVDSIRLVVCRQFDRLNAAQHELIDSYLANPSESTVFVMFATKVDKRKAWYRQIDTHGAILEVNEPYEREWPKWHGYFERKVGKTIHPEAWQKLVEMSGRSLSILWSELIKIAAYTGQQGAIQSADVSAVSAASGETDVFGFAEDVIARRSCQALLKYQKLLENGESDIKILSILVRQFRQLDGYLKLSAQGVTDSKAVASQLGVHPYFVSKIAGQAKGKNRGELTQVLLSLAEADYRLKTGEADLFSGFLAAYLVSGAFHAQKLS